ncbi:MAG TPA: hypothetical protein VI789_06685, partial [Dehalococcoidia bacterium]|nr:hypothetical protein [Dehalococcoidia bacterium]
FPNVETDAFVVMPNHIHGILTFVGAAPRGRPPEGQPRVVAPTLGDAVGWFKTMTTNAYIRGVTDHAWPPLTGAFGNAITTSTSSAPTTIWTESANNPHQPHELELRPGQPRRALNRPFGHYRPLPFAHQ